MHVELVAGAQGESTPAWMFGAAAFSVDGKPLGERGPAEVKLAPKQRIAIDIDLGPALEKTKLAEKGFKLAYANEKATDVTCRVAAKKGTDAAGPYSSVSGKSAASGSRSNLRSDCRPLHSGTFSCHWSRRKTWNISRGWLRSKGMRKRT